LGRDWLRKGYDEIVIQVTNAILSYLFEISLGGFDQVDGWQIRDTFASLTDILVQQDITVSERANVHDRSDDVLTIRVKNEGLESEKRAGNEAAIADFDLFLFI